MMRHGRYFTVALLPLLALGCGQPPLDEEAVRTALAKYEQFGTGQPEVPVEIVGQCDYFRSIGSRISFQPTACSELGLGQTSGGDLAAVLPQAIRRRVVAITPPSPGTAESSQPSAVFTWEWAAEELPATVQSCFAFAPREGMALLELQEGSWTVKQVVMERLIVKELECPS